MDFETWLVTSEIKAIQNTLTNHNNPNQPAPSGGLTKESMRKNFPVDEEVHNSVVAHLGRIESQGGGNPSITSWIKAAVLE